MHACMHACIHTYIHTSIHTCRPSRVTEMMFGRWLIAQMANTLHQEVPTAPSKSGTWLLGNACARSRATKITWGRWFTALTESISDQAATIAPWRWVFANPERSHRLHLASALPPAVVWKPSRATAMWLILLRKQPRWQAPCFGSDDFSIRLWEYIHTYIRTYIHTYIHT